jgi:predicted enzyme related to lactoylglutathione lyase
MTALAFGFTKLVVSDLARAQRFYERAFGMAETGRVTTREHTFALEEVMLSLGGERSHVLALTRYLEREVPPAGAAWTGFVVPDIEATLGKIAAAGGRVEVPVHENAEHGVLAALASDPDGHMIEIIQMLAPQDAPGAHEGRRQDEPAG